MEEGTVGGDKEKDEGEGKDGVGGCRMLEVGGWRLEVEDVGELSTMDDVLLFWAETAGVVGNFALLPSSISAVSSLSGPAEV
ncbi:hypothetical protein AJ79_05549 [Helicocarpus griseus UAMH5409]|uniref:Uncharacterized protein n=1 Tax=Helicocarpus griseus UAMH5409 TaxID=1447875 RepID=A0A2B7XMA1_9EURO|nr:hypothetical protein AJ79_05549 [Helicocarpus griseus UAMH5409]